MLKKKRIGIMAACLLLIFFIGDYNSINKKISRDLGVKIPRSLDFAYEDSHGGFLGDGITLAEASLTRNEIDRMVARSAESWTKTPMPAGIREKIINRRLADDGKDPSYNSEGIDELGEGYWIFKDRTPAGPYQDNTRNYSVGIIDIQERLIYYIKFDS